MSQLTLFENYDPPAITSGLVYCMTDGYLIKIGYTTRGIRQRSGELRARVIASGPGTREDERRYHTLFSHWCVGGEWFRIPDDGRMLARLRSLVTEWGGDSAAIALDQVIATNLRRAA